MTPHLASAGGDVEYVGLLALLLVLPRVLQRFRIPAAITSLAIGVAAGPLLGLFLEDPVVELLGTFGIVSIFLCAGLETDLRAMRYRARRLALHLALRTVLVAVVACLAVGVLELGARAGIVAALALLTPSGGFILESLPTLGLLRDEAEAIRTRVVATEILALGILLFAMQSTSPSRLAVSLGAVAAMIVVLPLVMRAVVRFVTPHAPKSEFAFLVLLAVVCALATRELGVYYLVGAFVVGLTAHRFRDQVPAMSSERMVHAVESFTSLFAPFYFFRAGTALRPEDLSWEALGLGLLFLVAGCGLRIASVVELAWWSRGESLNAALRKALPMMPTLVITLVLAEILRDRFDVPEAIVGGLVVYAVLNTLLPGLLQRFLPDGGYEGPQLPPWPSDHS